MIKKIVTHGNSSAILIDKPILEILKIDKNTRLNVQTDGENLIISPIRSGGRKKRVSEILRKVNKQHAKSFRELAK